MNVNLDNLIENECKKIYRKYWTFMKNDYIYYEKIKYHRKKIENINRIEFVKKNIYNKLGIISTYVFLTDLCNHIKLPGPYKMIDKALILLEHLLKGYSSNEMEIYMPSTSFYRLYESLYIKNYEYLDKWISNKLKYCFSSPLLRLLCAKKFNPCILDNITLFLDGHHNRIVYQDINLDKKELYSYKLKRNGLNTQIMIDVNKICVYISDSLPCRNNNDDKMLMDINLDQFYSETDCICFDGLYENTINEYVEKYKNIGYNITIHNFCFPIKKDKNIKLTKDEEYFNENLSGLRSVIESYFAELGNIFKRFNGQNKVRITDKKTYNIQLRLAIVLLNIKYFTDIFPIEKNNHYEKWISDDFDYFCSEIANSDVQITNKTIYKLEKINDIKEIQNGFLNSFILNDNIIENEIMEDANVENDESISKSYEIQYIIKHKKVFDKYEYFVKWKKYSKEHNSWVKETDFDTNEILEEYWKSIKRL